MIKPYNVVTIFLSAGRVVASPPRVFVVSSLSALDPQERDGHAVPGLRSLSPAVVVERLRKAPLLVLSHLNATPSSLASCFSRKDGMEWPARISVFLLHATKTKQTHKKKER